VFIAGGVESMSRAPWVMLKPEEGFPRTLPAMADTTIGWRFINPRMPREWTISLGETAEEVAKCYGISREEQDAFAHESQRRTKRALDEDRFRDELVPVEVATKGGPPTVVARDEHPRPETTLEILRGMRPAFVKDGGTVTAGSSSGINDGASAALVVSDRVAKDMRWSPLARIVATAVAGVAPNVMGIGPVPATRKVLERSGLSIDDMDLIELNEAFAAQAIACIRQLGADPERVNVNGGAIALGHPLGASGARIIGTLAHELKRRKKRYGLATMCIGVGQGIATVIENLS
jgi:acetyl-CoA acetyltransferase family protein